MQKHPHQLRLCISTQTPLIRFLRDVPDTGVPLPLARYAEGVDHQRSPGGVTRMMEAFLRRHTTLGRLARVDWLALSRQGPRSVLLDERVTLRHARLEPESLTRYAHAKASVWDAIHGLPPSRAIAPGEVERGLDAIGDAFAAVARDAHRARPFDAFYVHDFQLVSLGARLPDDVPRLFRWHIPVPAGDFPHRELVVRRLNDFDAVIVSTRAYAERLRAAGVKVPVHARHPYVDERPLRVVTAPEVAAFNRRWGLRERDAVFLLVARMDPMKSQDVAIRALARIAKDVPSARLVLVGGGGFSGGRRGGLALPHLAGWRPSLERLARELGVADRVVFTGNVDDAELVVAYARARAVLLPSASEGFGLAAVEGWMHGKPVIVSRGAGVAELVEEGVNGHTFAPGDEATLAEGMRRLAENGDDAREMGRRGIASARACHASRGADDVWAVLEGLVDASRKDAAAAAAAAERSLARR